MTRAALLLRPNDFATNPPDPPAEAVRLPLDSVDGNPNNPRSDVEVDVAALASNIAQFSLLQPITTRRVGDRYQVLGGHRRLAAFRRLHEQNPSDPRWCAIPAVVRCADDDSGYLMLLSAHAHSREWSPREQAAAIERLLLSGRTLKQAGQALSRTEGWVSKRARVFTDDVLGGYVLAGTLPTTVAEEFLPIRDVDQRRELADRAVADGWSQSDARAERQRLHRDRLGQQVAARARQLAQDLFWCDPARLSDETWQNLLTLQGRLVELFAARNLAA